MEKLKYIESLIKKGEVILFCNYLPSGKRDKMFVGGLKSKKELSKYLDKKLCRYLGCQSTKKFRKTDVESFIEALNSTKSDYTISVFDKETDDFVTMLS